MTTDCMDRGGAKPNLFFHRAYFKRHRPVTRLVRS
jgi:hypothetical protein